MSEKFIQHDDPTKRMSGKLAGKLGEGYAEIFTPDKTPEEIEEEAARARLKEKYIDLCDENGFILLRECREEFDGKQIKSIASLLDGSEDYNLGEGLRFSGDAGNYPDMMIHIDDLATFIARVKKHHM